MTEILRNDEWKYLIEAQNKTGLIHIDKQARAVHMCDLMTGEPLGAGEIPLSMQEDVVYGRGFEAFQELSEKYNVAIELILNNHGGKADTTKLLDGHSDTIKAASLGCIEINTLHPNAHELPLEVALQPDFTDPNEGLIEYTEAQLEAMKKFGVTALPIDIDVSPSGEVQQAFTKAWQAAEGHPPEVQAALYGTYQNARQYGFLAKIGMWLEQIESQRPDLLHQDMLVVVMLGSYHEAMIEKIEQFGASVHAPMTRDRAANVSNLEADAFKQMTSQAVIGVEALQKSMQGAATR